MASGAGRAGEVGKPWAGNWAVWLEARRQGGCTPTPQPQSGPQLPLEGQPWSCPGQWLLPSCPTLRPEGVQGLLSGRDSRQALDSTPALPALTSSLLALTPRPPLGPPILQCPEALTAFTQASALLHPGPLPSPVDSHVEPGPTTARARLLGGSQPRPHTPGLATARPQTRHDVEMSSRD